LANTIRATFGPPFSGSLEPRKIVPFVKRFFLRGHPGRSDGFRAVRTEGIAATRFPVKLI